MKAADIDMKNIALINDLSGFGRCSLTAAIPVVSAMGLQACPLPTAVLSAQTGFNSYFCDDYTDKMDIFTSEWQKMGVSFDGIQSGFLASPAQIKKVIDFLDIFQKDGTVYLADPVLGDSGNKMKAFSDSLLDGMKELVKRSSVCTPNLTELCLLSGYDYDAIVTFCESRDYNERIADAAYRLINSSYGRQTVIVTGIIRQKSGSAYAGNLAVNESGTFYTETPYTGKSFSGTGDLFAAVICGAMVKGMSVADAVKKAVSFLQPAIEEASAESTDRNYGICFEKYLYVLM